jgi:fermentation-respiration switch protein FrsA (DUF1100 family)
MIKIGAAVLLLLVLLYIVGIYFLVSACLVPSFMEKLDAFQTISEESFAQQVHTTDITANSEKIQEETTSWQAEVTGQKLTRETEDGYTLVAQEFFAKEESDNWVLLLHGYTGWKEEMYPYAVWYWERGYHVLVPDLRAQGESEGDFIGMGWTDSKDCELWISYILEQDPDAQIVLHGQSMGAATALLIAGNEPSEYTKNIKAVVSDCAYTSAYEMFGDKITEWFSLPPFPFVDSACLMLRLRGGYDLKKASPIDAVAKSTIPTLFIHGDADAMIDVSQAYELYDAAACEKELLIVEGAGHAQAVDKDPEGYWEAVGQFLEGR